MEEIKGPVEAEARASEFIRGRHRGVTRTLFRRVERGRNTWLVEGEVWFKRALFFRVRRSFKLQIRGENGEVASSEETKASTL